MIPVEIEGDYYNVYVYLRPGALEFIRRMSEIYEVVVYTASLQIVPHRLSPHLRSHPAGDPPPRPAGLELGGAGH